MWARYDAVRFEDIAQHGYEGANSDPNNTAFFPLFPVAIRMVSAVGVSVSPPGLLIAAVGSLVAGVFLYRLAEAAFGEVAGSQAVLYLMLFPTAVFLVAPYSESLFLAGAVPAFYYARRAQWPRAALRGPSPLAPG
jgi:Gpi18-like mannosyltransferase